MVSCWHFFSSSSRFLTSIIIFIYTGWWRGQSGNQTGWFPSNYTTEESDNDELHTYAMAENVLDIVVALYSFNSNNDTELSFEKGDRLEIIDRPPSDPEWFKARNQKGQIGLVPRNYLQELQEYLNTPYRGNGPDSLDRRNDGVSTMQSNHGNGTSQPERPVLSGKSWYYGAITRNQCDTVLNSHGHDGDFLIRDSETNVSLWIFMSHFGISHSFLCLLYFQSGDFSVSLKAPGRNKHFRVHVEGNMYCIGQRKFHTLDQLVDHYQRAPIYTNKQGEKLYLVRPLPKANGT